MTLIGRNSRKKFYLLTGDLKAAQRSNEGLSGGIETITETRQVTPQTKYWAPPTCKCTQSRATQQHAEFLVGQQQSLYRLIKNNTHLRKGEYEYISISIQKADRATTQAATFITAPATFITAPISEAQMGASRISLPVVACLFWNTLELLFMTLAYTRRSRGGFS